MKNTIYLILSLFILTSCEKMLDVKPTTAVDSETSITSTGDVEKAINGCYDALQSGSYYGQSYIEAGDLSADNLDEIGTSPDLYQINNCALLADNGVVESLWSQLYDGINRVNNVLAKLPSVPMTELQRDKYEGNLLFLRGLFHFDLLRLYGGIPIKTMPSSSNISQMQAPRATVAETYAQIIQDLSFAELNLPESNSGMADKNAASALLARVFLYRYNALLDAGDLDSVILRCNILIGKYQLVLNYSELFTSESNSELIFDVKYNSQDANILAYYFFSKKLAGRYEYKPSDNLINSFEPDDTRKSISVAMDGDNKPYCFKYRDLTNGSDKVYVIRLAEIYLIRAEANCYKQQNMTQVQGDINAIRNRAGLINTTAATYPDLLLAIENERRHEFAFEGQRWFDLVRTGRALNVLSYKVTDIDQTLWPIPQSEIQTNTNPGMFQNDGY